MTKPKFREQLHKWIGEHERLLGCALQVSLRPTTEHVGGLYFAWECTIAAPGYTKATAIGHGSKIVLAIQEAMKAFGTPSQWGLAGIALSAFKLETEPSLKTNDPP